MPKTRHVFVFFLLLECQVYTVAYAQGKYENRNYEHFRDLVKQHKSDSAKAYSFAKTWLGYAKAQQNWSECALAYKAIVHTQKHVPTQLKYADSMVYAARLGKHDALAGAGYITKGMIVFEYDKKAALESYLLADKHLARTSDKYSRFKVKYVIAQTKFYLGFYNEAISLFKECLPFYEVENDRAYLNTLHALGLCYNRLGKIDQSSFFNKKGLEIAREFSNHEMDRFFHLSEAVNDYYRNHYAKSVKILDSLLPVFKKRQDIANKTVSNFYLAKNYWELKQFERALPYLKAVDTAFADTKYLRPELRRNYEMLIDYYKKSGNQEQKDYYVDRLLRADSILDRNFEYLSTRIFKVYDTEQLKREQHSRHQGEKQTLYYISTRNISCHTCDKFVDGLNTISNLRWCANRKSRRKHLNKQPRTP